jgi:hypothetical protein
MDHVEGACMKRATEEGRKEGRKQFFFEKKNQKTFFF